MSAGDRGQRQAQPRLPGSALAPKDLPLTWHFEGSTPETQLLGCSGEGPEAEDPERSGLFSGLNTVLSSRVPAALTLTHQGPPLSPEPCVLGKPSLQHRRQNVPGLFINETQPRLLAGGRLVFSKELKGREEGLFLPHEAHAGGCLFPRVGA